MVDTPYLEKKIKDSGKTKTYLATKLGLSRSSFYEKVNGITAFTEKQATILCEEIYVKTLAERKKIFCL